MLIVNLLVDAQQLSYDKLWQTFVFPASWERSVVGLLDLVSDVLFSLELIGLLHHRQKRVLESLLFGLTTMLLYL